MRGDEENRGTCRHKTGRHVRNRHEEEVTQARRGSYADQSTGLGRQCKRIQAHSNTSKKLISIRFEVLYESKYLDNIYGTTRYTCVQSGSIHCFTRTCTKALARLSIWVHACRINIFVEHGEDLVHVHGFIVAVASRYVFW